MAAWQSVRYSRRLNKGYCWINAIVVGFVSIHSLIAIATAGLREMPAWQWRVSAVM